MTVVVLPDFTEYNPYQSNLADALDEDVVLGSGEGHLPILSTALSTEDVSIIHLHWLDPYMHKESDLETILLMLLTVFQLAAVRLVGYPVVWTVHNVLSHDSRYPRLEKWFKHAFVRFGFCAHVIVHCEAMEDRVIEEYGLPEWVRRRISVVPHGHYRDNYEDTVSRATARERFGFDEEETVFLFFGQIKPYKGLLNLVEAFGSIDDPASRLLIAGNPTDERLEHELTERIADDDRIDSVLEFIAEEEIQFYMNAADVVVLPYTKIATSGSAILVMSFGRALIIPRLGCLPELLDDEGAVMYSPGAERGLRDALLEAGDRDLHSMGEHNARLVRQYDWSGIAERTARIYARTQQ